MNKICENGLFFRKKQPKHGRWTVGAYIISMNIK